MKKKVFFSIALLIISILINILARLVPGFANFYVQNLYGVITMPMKRLSNLFTFSIGEFELYFAFIMTIVLVVFLLLLLIRGIRNKIGRFIKGYLVFYINIASIVCLIMTLNCFVLYQVDTLDSRINTEYSKEELAQYRDYLVERLNDLSVKMIRNDSGLLIDDKEYKHSLVDESLRLMTRLSEKSDFKRLSGDYSYPKPLLLSGFFSKQYIMGYFFPFSMESNYNNIMYIDNIPYTVCHELAHQKGYILEDEANFIAYLACVNSDNEYMQYCGLLGVFNYVNNDFYDSIGRDKDIYLSHIQTNDYVKKDNMFLTEETWDRINSSGLDTETVHKVSNEFTDTVLKSNGVSDGMNSYSRVVKLLLNNYYGK